MSSAESFSERVAETNLTDLLQVKRALSQARRLFGAKQLTVASTERPGLCLLSASQQG